MTILSRAELRHFTREGLRELHQHASAMRDLYAQFLNSGPGGTYGQLDQLVSDIEDWTSELDEHFLARKLADQMNATDPLPGID